MTVVKRPPYRDLMYLQDRMNRVFEDSIKDRTSFSSPGEWVPSVDIFEDDASITLKAELPGVRRDDILLDVSNGAVTISGKKEFDPEGHTESYHMIERQYGSFRRSFSLPESIDPEKIDAKFEKGVLEVILPKERKSISRKIPISKG